MSDLPAWMLQSITWDQGPVMGQHLSVSGDLERRVDFCDPDAPWQRGSNENTKGLLRQYFPKGTNLSIHGPDHLRAVQDELSRRPRLVLNDANIDIRRRMRSTQPRGRILTWHRIEEALPARWRRASGVACPEPR